jgi:hypothetical protein
MNYDQVIEIALSNGQSFEEIAAAFSAALNKKEQASREADRRRTLKDTYSNVIEDFYAGHVPVDVHVAAAAVICENLLDNDSWSTEAVEKLYNILPTQTKAAVNLIRGEKSDDPVDRFCADLYSALVNQEPKKSDEDVIAEFLRALKL